MALRVAKRLIDAGISVQRIRKSVRSLERILPRTRQPLANLALVAGDGAVLVFAQGTAFEAESGQAWVPEVARSQREIRPRTSTPSSSRGPRPVRAAARAGTKGLSN